MLKCNYCSKVGPENIFIKDKRSKTGYVNTCRACKSLIDKKYREKLSIAHLGHKPSEETKKKMSLSHKGTKKPWGGKFKRTFGTRKKLSERFKGEKSSLWRGGVSNENHKIRQSFEYKLWRTAVFMRDDYTCKICGKRGVYIQADHIIPFALDKNKRLDVNNGRTLCLDCHKTTESYMNNKILQKCDLTALSYS